MPDDLRPSELVELEAAVAVPEHPFVLAGLVELAEVAVHHPPPRFVGVAVPRPPEREPPHVNVQCGEDTIGHHSAIVSCPTAHDRVDRTEDPGGVRAPPRS